MEQSDLINKLFSYTRETELKDKSGEVVMRVYQRLVGDLDIQKARVSALRVSRELRLKLRDTESDEYVGLVQPIEDLDKSALVMLLSVDSVDVIKQEIDRTFYFAEPPEPDESATTEDHENYVAKWNSWEADRNKEYSAQFVRKMDIVKHEYEEMSTEELITRAKTLRINALCEQELKTRFIEMCVVLGTYSDAQFRKHLFDTYLEYANQPDEVKNQLLEGYAGLEMSTVNLKESTKSQASVQA